MLLYSDLFINVCVKKRLKTIGVVYVNISMSTFTVETCSHFVNSRLLDDIYPLTRTLLNITRTSMYV